MYHSTNASAFLSFTQTDGSTGMWVFLSDSCGTAGSGHARLSQAQPGRGKRWTSPRSFSPPLNVFLILRSQCISIRQRMLA